jgi:hypothetical protein
MYNYALPTYFEQHSSALDGIVLTHEGREKAFSGIWVVSPSENFQTREYIPTDADVSVPPETLVDDNGVQQEYPHKYRDALVVRDVSTEQEDTAFAFAVAATQGKRRLLIAFMRKGTDQAIAYASFRSFYDALMTFESGVPADLLDRAASRIQVDHEVAGELEL